MRRLPALITVGAAGRRPDRAGQCVGVGVGVGVCVGTCAVTGGVTDGFPWPWFARAIELT
jgi:hypothetical protein